MAIVALPAPHLVRAAVAAVVLLGLVGSATVASADALPTEPLYPVKVASEEIRLALAQSPEDRAAVQLSMAEHRLDEAERLALRGIQPEAIVAGSTYAADLAGAAADLASVERAAPDGAAVVARLKERLAEQQARAARVARELASEPRGEAIAPVFRTVASFAPPAPSGTSVSEAIAEHGADVAGQIATVAAEIAAQASDEASHREGVAPGAASAATVAGPKLPALAAMPAPAAGGEKTTKLDPAAAPSGVDVHPQRTEALRPAIDPQTAREAAERAKHEAEKAREAVEKAKERAKAPPRAGSHNENGGAARDDRGDKGAGNARP
ncbi:MAG: hypothetical protein KGK34_07180 [Chloroflexota bacterium]|nr:hypothetical protein [Chloroflexota bacterium]